MAKIEKEMPPWWEWELEMTSHLLKRMVDRGFNEVKLREMLHNPEALREDIESGRYVVQTRLRHVAWEVIVEPDAENQLLVVITAYPAEPLP